MDWVGRLRARALLLAVGLLVGVGALSAPAQARTISWGSNLAAAPDRGLNAGFDAVYWSTHSGRSRVRAPRKGQVTTVTVRGYSLAGTCARLGCSPRFERTILFQDLRPVRGGKLRVVATSQPFELPATNARYSFHPGNFFVKKGDSVGMATVGGGFRVFATVRGSSTARFSGAGKNKNGARVRGSSVANTELLLKVTEKV